MEFSNELRKEVGRIQKSYKKQRYNCLYPGCNKKSIGSHSQQRGGQLKVISRDKHVYALNRSYYDALLATREAFRLKKTAIKNASVFPGFCSEHDDSVFSNIEKKSLLENDYRQESELFLRTLSYEVSQKQKVYDIAQSIVNQCKGMMDWQLIILFEQQRLGRFKFLHTDKPYYMQSAFEAYGGTRERIESYWCKVDRNLGVSVSTVFSPISGFMERNIDRIQGKPQVMFTFNLIPEENCTWVVVSWLREHQKYSEVIIKEAESDLISFINRICVSETEDLCISPAVWESLDVFTKEDIHNAMRHENHRGPLEHIPKLIKKPA